MPPVVAAAAVAVLAAPLAASAGWEAAVEDVLLEDDPHPAIVAPISKAIATVSTRFLFIDNTFLSPALILEPLDLLSILYFERGFRYIEYFSVILKIFVIHEQFIYCLSSKNVYFSSYSLITNNFSGHF